MQSIIRYANTFIRHNPENSSHSKEKQPNAFRVPSPSDSEDDSEHEEIVNGRNSREPSLELLSSKFVPSVRIATRVPSEDVILVSQSRVTNSNDKNKAHIDLTVNDTPEAPDPQPLLIDNEPDSALPEHAHHINSKRLEDLNVMDNPIPSSSTYQLDYSEDDEDDDRADQEMDEDGKLPRIEPDPTPGDLELIEELLDYNDPKMGAQESKGKEDSVSIDSARDETAIVQDSFATRPLSPALAMDTEEILSYDDDSEEVGSNSAASVNTEDSLFEEHERKQNHEENVQDSFIPGRESPMPSEASELNPTSAVSVYDSSEEGSDYSSQDEDTEDYEPLIPASKFSSQNAKKDAASQREYQAIPVTKSAQCEPTPVIAPYPIHPSTAFNSAQRAPSPSDAAMAKSTAPFYSGSGSKREQYIPPLSSQGNISANDSFSRPGAEEATYCGNFNFSSPASAQASLFPNLTGYGPEAHTTTPSTFAFYPQITHNYFSPAEPRYGSDHQDIWIGSKSDVYDHVDEVQNTSPKSTAKPAKVHISDIVNSSPTMQPAAVLEQIVRNETLHSDQGAEEDTLPNIESNTSPLASSDNMHLKPKALKRKAVKIEEPEDTHLKSSPRPQDDLIAVEDSQFVNIPYAQPDIVEDSLPLLEKFNAEAENSGVTPQNGLPKTSSSSSTSLLGTLPFHSSRGEPTRKKQKITPRISFRSHPRKGSRTAVKTFVSGCIAGAVTVVGAAAALIATMPASLQEEALRSI